MKRVHILYQTTLAPMPGCHLQALCTEASLHALRRHYPQIYDTHDKLLVDPAAVRVARPDFLAAFKTITPSSHRSAVAHARWGCRHCLLYVCLYVCMYVCLYVCMSVRTYVCMHVCMYVCMYACLCSVLWVDCFVCLVSYYVSVSCARCSCNLSEQRRELFTCFCRPLPAVVVPCLGNPLATILGHLKSVFPPAAACLAAQGTSNSPNAGLVPSSAGAATDLVWDDDEDDEDQGIASRHMQFNHILLKM